MSSQDTWTISLLQAMIRYPAYCCLSAQIVCLSLMYCVGPRAAACDFEVVKVLSRKSETTAAFRPESHPQYPMKRRPRPGMHVCCDFIRVHGGAWSGHPTQPRFRSMASPEFWQEPTPLHRYACSLCMVPPKNTRAAIDGCSACSSLAISLCQVGCRPTSILCAIVLGGGWGGGFEKMK